MPWVVTMWKVLFKLANRFKTWRANHKWIAVFHCLKSFEIQESESTVQFDDFMSYRTLRSNWTVSVWSSCHGMDLNRRLEVLKMDPCWSYQSLFFFVSQQELKEKVRLGKIADYKVIVLLSCKLILIYRLSSKSLVQVTSAIFIILCPFKELFSCIFVSDILSQF